MVHSDTIRHKQVGDLHEFTRKDGEIFEIKHEILYCPNRMKLAKYI